MSKGDLISRSELLKEFDPNGERLDPIFVRGRIVYASGTSEQEIRNKTIEEFSERLKDSLLHKYRHLLNVDTDGFEWLTIDAVETHIDEIAESMKGEKE